MSPPLPRKSTTPGEEELQREQEIPGELLEQPVREAETALGLAPRLAWVERQTKWTVQEQHKVDVP